MSALFNPGARFRRMSHSFSTTARYLHITTAVLKSTHSPFDGLEPAPGGQTQP
jgi:hypothetical protein